MTMNRKDFFFKQAVQQSELDAAFDQVDQRFRDGKVDHGSFGIAANPLASSFKEMEVVENTPTGMQVKVGTGFAYTKQGDRIYRPTSVDVVNCAVDKDGASTIPSAGNQRYISIFIVPSYVLSDPRLDGFDNTVYFDKAVRYAFEVEAGTEAASNPTRPALRNDAVLLADVLLDENSTAIVNPTGVIGVDEIDETRKELFELGGKIIRPDSHLRMPVVSEWKTNLTLGNPVPPPDIYRNVFPYAVIHFKNDGGGNADVLWAHNINSISTGTPGTVFHINFSSDHFADVDDFAALVQLERAAAIGAHDVNIAKARNPGTFGCRVTVTFEGAFDSALVLIYGKATS